MEKELSTPALRLLRCLHKVAPNMKLSEAMNYVDDMDEYHDSVERLQFIVMMLLKGLGVDDNGNLKDKEIAKKLSTVDDKFWIAFNQAIHVHGGFACSPFTPKDWVEQRISKYNLNTDAVKAMKNSQLSILNDEL